jgi:hypothetical protein
VKTWSQGGGGGVMELFLFLFLTYMVLYAQLIFTKLVLQKRNSGSISSELPN